MKKITQLNSTRKIIFLILVSLVFISFLGYFIWIGLPAIKTERLIQKLKDKDYNIRRQTISELSKIEDEWVIKHLYDLFWDEVPVVRWEAAKTLGEKRKPQITQLLIATLKNEAPYIRELAAYALGKAEDIQAVEPLILALMDENESTFVRIKSAEALGKIKDARAIKPLIATLKTLDLSLQEKVIDTLITIGTPTVTLLKVNLDDSDLQLQEVIVKILRKIRWCPTLTKLFGALCRYL